MKITKIVKTMKEVNSDKLLLLKIGNFYYQYGKDAYIIAYVFGYKIKILEENIPFSAFPKTVLNKVITKLEDNKISYFIADKSQNYEVIEEENFKKENTYINYYNKAHKYISKKNKIKNIYIYLLKNIDKEDIKEKISKIEEILYEV